MLTKVWFQHPLTADNLGVGFVLVHHSVDSLVTDAVEFCGFGDCLRLKWNFFSKCCNVLFALSSARSTSNLAFVSASMALISISASTRDRGLRLHQIKHANSAQPRYLKNWMMVCLSISHVSQLCHRSIPFLHVCQVGLCVNRTRFEYLCSSSPSWS